jgi:AcrB/AcrD/AcrF family
MTYSTKLTCASSINHLSRRRRPQRGLDDRLHHRGRHRHAKRHHARLAHSPPDAGRGIIDFRDAVERDAQERLVPILMTAMAAGLALIPLALGGGKTGSEIQTPMAIVILCGLTTSTLLNMIVVPTMYLRDGEAE